MFYESIRIKSTICGKDPFIVTEHFLLNDLYFESWNLELFLFLLVYHGKPSHFTPFERIWSISCLFPSILRKSKTTSHGETLAKKNIIHASATDDTSCNVNFCWRLAALGEEKKLIPSTRAVRECIPPLLGISESFQVASCFNSLPLFGRGPTTITTGSLGD